MAITISYLDSDSTYGKRRQQALALINQLRAIGYVASDCYIPSTHAFFTHLTVYSAQADLDLPRIAVIGNQSAGKSSLVEAISGVRSSASQ